MPSALELSVCKCDLSMWKMFREHHYLNTKRLGAGVRCYVAKLGDKPVVFIAVAHVKMRANIIVSAVLLFCPIIKV
jgi:hypothetical protein